MAVHAARWGAQVVVIALSGLAVSTCQLADVLRPPGAKNVTLVYGGDSILVQGRVVAAAAAATADGAPFSSARFAYASSDTTVVAVSGGDSLRPLKRGTATLTVTLVSAILPRSPPAITRTLRVVAGSVVLDSAHVTFLSVGDTATLHATPLDAGGTAIPGAASWLSSDTTVVAVSAAGRLLALKNGTATVRAIVDFDTAGIPVTVRQTLAHFTFDQPSLLIDALRATAAVTPTARDARGSAIAGVSPAWSSGDTAIATVSASGAATSVRVGSTFLYARQGAVTDSLAVTVAQRATRIVISPKPVPDITSLNAQRQLNAVAYDRKNVLIPSPPLAWSITDPTVLSVSPQGLVTGLAVGSAKVFVALAAGVDSVTVNVTNAPASVRVAPRTASSTATGDTLAFTAVAFNGRGDTVPGVTVTWRTPDAAIVQVTSDGHAILKGVGTARVIAVAGSLADTATVTATNVPTTLHFKLPAGVTVGPLQRTLTAIGDVDTTPVVIQNARNADLPRGAVTWSADDPNIVRVTALGVVTARDTGQTLVRITGSGLADSASYTVTNTPSSIVIEGRAKDTLTALGQVLPFVVSVRNHRGALIPNYPVTWRSTNTAVADTVVRDTVTAKGFGKTLLTATAGSVAAAESLIVRHLSRWTVDNASVVNPRVGSASRPYARIQDAVEAAGAKDTVVVKVGAGAYSETVALSRSLTLLGDSTAFVAGGRNPALLPLIGHDSGAAGITAYTSAPMTLRYLALRHSLDGPAVDDSGSDVRIDYFYVNPPGSATSRIGRGISIKNSISGTSLRNCLVDSVRGYGVRLQSVSNAGIVGVYVFGVDSIPGVEEGAAFKLVNSSTDSVSASLSRLAQIGVLVTGSASVRINNNIFSGNVVGMRLDAGDFAAGSPTTNDVYDNDSAGVVNRLAGGLTIQNGWWGDSLGPRVNAVPDAVGDSVVGNVAFTPVRLLPGHTGTVPALVRKVRGDNQSSSAGNTLNQAFSVRVVDVNGLPVPGVTVTFTVASGGGSFGGQPSTTVTSSTGGLAQATYMLGSGKNVTNTVTVSVGTAGVGAVTFSALGT